MEEKTYVFGNDNSMAAIASALANNNMGPMMAAMNSGGFGGNMGAWWIIIILAVLWGQNGFGRTSGNTDAILSALNGDTGRDMLLSAITGNGTAISQLASTLNCDVNSLASTLSTISLGISNVGNQVGLSGQQVINAIQSGNTTLAAQLAQCCCDNRLLTTQQGYESQLRTVEQTGILGGKIDAQTAVINDKFCQLEMRDMQAKIDSLQEEKSTLIAQISNSNQTAAIQAYINSVVTPLATDIAAIKATQPNTVSVPYPQLTAVPSSYVYGYNTGSIWS